MEGDDEHFEGPKDPAHIGKVPEEGDDDDIGDDDAEGDFLGFVDGEIASRQDMVDTFDMRKG